MSKFKELKLKVPEETYKTIQYIQNKFEEVYGFSITESDVIAGAVHEAKKVYDGKE